MRQEPSESAVTGDLELRFREGAVAYDVARQFGDEQDGVRQRGAVRAVSPAGQMVAYPAPGERDGRGVTGKPEGVAPQHVRFSPRPQHLRPTWCRVGYPPSAT
ncbi:hypothetical protein GCM10009540_55250 [Streptomyces turgidiscabies]